MPDIHTSSLTDSNVASISIIAAPVFDQFLSFANDRSGASKFTATRCQIADRDECRLGARAANREGFIGGLERKFSPLHREASLMMSTKPAAAQRTKNSGSNISSWDWILSIGMLALQG